jgi:hypothetical protein
MLAAPCWQAGCWLPVAAKQWAPPGYSSVVCGR